MNYNSLQHKLKKSNITLNKKELSQVAIRDQQAFNQLITFIQTADTNI